MIMLKKIGKLAGAASEIFDVEVEKKSTYDQALYRRIDQ